MAWYDLVTADDFASLIPEALLERLAAADATEGEASNLFATLAAPWYAFVPEVAPREDLGDRVKNEVKILLCTDDPKYGPTREIMEKVAKAGASALAGLIAGAIVGALGVPFLSPLVAVIVAWLMWQALTAGVAAWCDAH